MESASRPNEDMGVHRILELMVQLRDVQIHALEPLGCALVVRRSPDLLASKILQDPALGGSPSFTSPCAASVPLAVAWPLRIHSKTTANMAPSTGPTT